MMYNINYTKNFNTLKEFYIPAICHPILKGRTKYYQLSVPLNGQEIIVKKAITWVWQKWRFSAPQTHLWLIKHWFSASTFVVEIATFAKPQNVSGKFTDDIKPIRQ